MVVHTINYLVVVLLSMFLHSIVFILKRVDIQMTTIAYDKVIVQRTRTYGIDSYFDLVIDLLILVIMVLKQEL